MSAITIGAVVTTGAALYGAYNQNKQAKRMENAASGMSFDPKAMQKILAEIDGYQAVDVSGVASRTATSNAGQGVNLARKSATKLNKTATEDTIAAMNAQFGGADDYDQIRQRALDDIADNLDGQVSRSTRQQIGRRLLGSGVSELGDGAVSDTMTGYLGLTSEGLAAQGQEQFKSLYQTWRQAVPLVNGAQILDRFTMSPDNAVQAEIANATAAAQSELAIAGLNFQALGMEYQANMNQTSMRTDALTMKANATNQAIGAIASGVGTVAGSYSARQTQPAKTPVITPAYSGGSGRNVSARPSYIG